MKKFKCTRCGLCCMNLNKNHLYDDLNDGKGVCIYFDKKGRLCKIYDNRPLKCNVQKSYDLLFKQDMSYDEYLKLNYEACRLLKEDI